MKTQVKICGLSTEATLQAALDAGTDYIGLNFYPPSPRYVSLEAAARLAAQARGKAKIVALVVDADDAKLSGIVRATNPDFIQTHGKETPERVAAIAKTFGRPVIVAIKVKEAADVARAKAYRDVAVMPLFDAKAPVHLLPGGNGLSFDWTLLKGKDGLYMLSGGLTPENVGAAVSLTRAPIVDVSSGVETLPGQKEASLIAKFIAAAKAAS